MKAFRDYLLYKGLSYQTVEKYIKNVQRFRDWTIQENIPIEQVSYNDVLHYIQSNRAQIKQSTQSKYINSIKHYYNYLTLTDQTLENPTTSIQIKGVQRKTLYYIFSKADLEQLYNDFKIPDENNDSNKNQNWFRSSLLATKRNKIILGLLVYQGLRSSELSRLELKDVKLREGKIYVSGTRRSNERTLNLESHQVLDIMEYSLQVRPELLKLSNRISESLFVSVGQSDGFTNLIQKLTQKLKVQNPKVNSLKQLRASVITHWIKHYNLRQVQYMSGHRFISSTESYLMNDIEDLLEDISKYHPI